MKFLKKASKDPTDYRRLPRNEGNNVRAFSYYSSRTPDQHRESTGRKQPNEPKLMNFVGRLPGRLAIAVIVVSLLSVLWLDTTPELKSATSDDKQSVLRPQEAYLAASQQLLGSSVFNRLKFTINTIKLSKQLEDRFPELNQASITMPLVGHRLLIELEPIKPLLALNASGKVLIIDEQGRAVIDSKDVEGFGGLNLPLIRDESGLDIEVGNIALTSNQVKFITDLKAQFDAAKQSVNRITLPRAVNELRVQLNGADYYIKFDMSGDPRVQAGSYLAVIGKLRASKTVPAQYIDVRVDNRVFYK